jgi:hypothetical protein
MLTQIIHNAVCTIGRCKYTGTYLGTSKYCGLLGNDTMLPPARQLLVFHRNRVEMKALCSSEILVAIYHTTTWWHNQEDNMNLHVVKTSNLTHDMYTFSYLNRPTGEGKKPHIHKLSLTQKHIHTRWQPEHQQVCKRLGQEPPWEPRCQRRRAIDMGKLIGFTTA